MVQNEDKYIIYRLTAPLGLLPRECVVGWLIGTKTSTPLSAYLEPGENYSSVEQGDIDICGEQNRNGFHTLFGQKTKRILPQNLIDF